MPETTRHGDDRERVGNVVQPALLKDVRNAPQVAVDALQRLGDSLLARSCHPGYLLCRIQPPATSGADRMKWVTGRRRHGKVRPHG